MATRLDIVIYGATGFTGKYLLQHMHKLVNTSEVKLTWGVAGRSEQKLKNVLLETAKKIGVDDISSIPIITADSNDEESVIRMTAQAKLIINLCGPYQLYGEVVIKCCIETGTHQVDISVEPLFVRGMQFKYHKAAEEKGVYIVSACGVGSIPADIGLTFLEKNFKGILNSVETYGTLSEEGRAVCRPVMHYGTWESLIHGLENFRKLMALKNELYPEPLLKLQPKLCPRFLFRRESNKWAIGYPILDKYIMLQSQYYFYEHEGKRPVQIYCYAYLNSFRAALHLIWFCFIIGLLAICRFGSKLLLRHPSFFSAGFASHVKPAEDALSRQYYSYTFEGEGWTENLVVTDQCTTKPNKAIVGRVSGTDPYRFTAIAAPLCAITILTEPKQLPTKGGVYTSAVAFAKTSLIEQLQRNGVVFEILSYKDI